MMKKLLFAALVSAFVFASCSEDEPVYGDPTIVLTSEEMEEFSYGESKEFPVKITDAVSAAVTAPAGWTAEVSGDKLVVTAPASGDQAKENSGEIVINVDGYNAVGAVASVKVKAYRLLTFEDVGAEYLAGPTAYGDNLYDGGYTGYLDPVSDLFFHTTTDGYKFASGGLAISQWNDVESAGYMNQCSVYYGTHNEKNGGYGNSKTFVAAFISTFSNTGAYMYFQTDGAEHVIDHAYFMNSTYAALSMKNGDGFGKAFSYEDGDWFKLTIIGVDAEGETTGEVEVYLADFRTSDAGGILEEWKFVDLTPLGKVHRINFEMSSSDGEGMWMNTPAYFCMDNIAVEL